MTRTLSATNVPPPVASAPLIDGSAAAQAALVALGTALKLHAYHFTTVTPVTHRRVNARAANALAADLPGIFGWNRAFPPTLAPQDVMDAMRAGGLAGADGDLLRSRVRASTLDGQLYFHSGYPTNAGDAVFFGPDTYRFIRALRAALAGRAGTVLRAADIGCGAGPGAITVALACPEATVFAVDINPVALAITEVNARLAGVTNVAPVESDLLGAVSGQFDLIISNPPYLVDLHERAYRHGGGALGAHLSLAVVGEAVRRLAPGGMLMLYTGVAMEANADPFLAAFAPPLAAAGFTWTYEEIDPDVFGEELDAAPYLDTERIAAVCLCATRPLRPA